jgi:hypothetical protein
MPRSFDRALAVGFTSTLSLDDLDIPHEVARFLGIRRPPQRVQSPTLSSNSTVAP